MWRLKRNETLQKFKKNRREKRKKKPESVAREEHNEKNVGKNSFCPGGLVLFGGRKKGSDYLRLLNEGCTKIDAII